MNVLCLQLCFDITLDKQMDLEKVPGIKKRNPVQFAPCFTIDWPAI